MLKCVELKEFETLYEADQQVCEWRMEGFIGTIEFDLDEDTYIAKKWQES